MRSKVWKKWWNICIINPHDGKIIIDDAMKASIDGYYAQYGGNRLLKGCKTGGHHMDEKIYRTMKGTRGHEYRPGNHCHGNRDCKAELC